MHITHTQVISLYPIIHVEKALKIVYMHPMTSGTTEERERNNNVLIFLEVF
jgi:hypothetical protein